MMTGNEAAARGGSSSWGTGESRRVLIVDDDPDFADSLDLLLAEAGYTTRVANDAGQAVAAAADFDAGLAILDYRLGDTTGVDLVEPLKQHRPNLLCILATAHSETDTAIAALRHGIYDYFAKPLNIDRFMATLERGFDKIRLEQEIRATAEALNEARKIRALTQIAGGVAHNFNNILAAMQSSAELLEDRLADGGDARPWLDMLHRGIERASAITRGLTAYTAAQFLRPERMDPAVLFDQAAASLARELPQAIDAELSVASDLPIVLVDPSGFEAALQCLVQNAIESMPDGGKLAVAVTYEEAVETDRNADGDQIPPGRYVMISVRDTGHGMSAEVAARAIEPFFSSRGMAEKTGLGLSIVYGFAKQSGGHVTIDSAEARGTTVRLYLPPADDDENS